MNSQPYQWQPQPQKPSKPRRERPGWVKVLVLLVGGFAVVIAISFVMAQAAENDPPPDRTPTADTYSMFEAQIDCEHAIEARLVSPGTAEFEHTSTKPKGSGWDVRGYVDSENRMGGTMRSVFGCNATEASVVVTELTQMN